MEQLGLGLARSWGILIAVISVGMMVNRKTLDGMKESKQNYALIFVLGLIALIAGALQVSFYNVGELNYRGLVTLMGWITLVRATLRLFAPDSNKSRWNPSARIESSILLSQPPRLWDSTWWRSASAWRPASSPDGACCPDLDRPFRARAIGRASQSWTTRAGIFLRATGSVSPLISSDLAGITKVVGTRLRVGKDPIKAWRQTGLGGGTRRFPREK